MWAVYAPAMDEAMKRRSTTRTRCKLAELLNKLGGIEHVECREDA